jgi:enterochelin esterase-like enzyme
MGGGESLLTGLTAPLAFGWVGAFSSAVPADPDAEFPEFDAAALNAQVKLLWIACGTEDRLIDSNRRFRGWLDTKRARHVDVDTPGAHVWMVWRRNLAAFAPLLFR